MSEAYWHARYLEALEKMERATSFSTRSAYMDLAIHYHRMRTRFSAPAKAVRE